MEDAKLKEQMALIVQKGEALAITSDQDYLVAGELLKAIKSYQKDVKEKLNPFIEAAKKVVEDAKTGLESAKSEMAKWIDPTTRVEGILKTRIADYDSMLRKRQEEERRKAEEEARKKAEEEALAKAQVLQDVGLNEAAEAVIEAPVVVPKVKAPEVTKIAGVHTQTRWSAELMDLMTLVKAVAAGTVPLMYLQADMTALNKAAVLMKEQFNIPGVVARPSTTTVVR